MEEGWPPTAEGFYRHLITRGRSVDTASTYTANLRLFWRWCRGSPSEATVDDCERFLADQLAHFAKSTAHVRISAVKAYYGWLKARGVRFDNPALELTVHKDKHLARPPLSESDELRLMTACKNQEERLLFIVGILCGLRISELVGVLVQNVYPERGLILVKGKGSKERWIAPPDLVFRAIAVYTDKKRGPLFDLTREQARRILRRVANHAGVSGFFSHRMRITFASRFLAATHDLHSLQVLMGHADPGVTAKYAAFDAQEIALSQMRNMRLRGPSDRLVG